MESWEKLFSRLKKCEKLVICERNKIGERCLWNFRQSGFRHTKIWEIYARFLRKRGRSRVQSKEPSYLRQPLEGTDMYLQIVHMVVKGNV